MKNTLLSVLIIAASFSNTAIADNTFGFGLGSLYNGMGLNFGRGSDASLMYSSLGWMGGSSKRSRNTARDIVTHDSSYETNCGLGLGCILCRCCVETITAKQH